MSLRDVAEFFRPRGFEFTHETVRDWEARFAPIFAQELRAKREGKVGSSFPELVTIGVPSSNTFASQKSLINDQYSPPEKFDAATDHCVLLT